MDPFYKMINNASEESLPLERCYFSHDPRLSRGLEEALEGLYTGTPLKRR